MQIDKVVEMAYSSWISPGAATLVWWWVNLRLCMQAGGIPSADFGGSLLSAMDFPFRIDELFQTLDGGCVYGTQSRQILRATDRW